MIPQFQVSDFLAVVNQSFAVAFGMVEIEGEVMSFNINHQKYVFFDLKDAEGSVSCFMTVWQLRVAIEDGMRVIVRAMPKLTQKGRFSLTVSEIRPVGEGSLKRSFDLLRAKLDKEGIFDAARKRPMPELPSHVAVISSTGAAGYADFMKISEERCSGVRFTVANVQVQGTGAAEQIIRAIEYLNQLAEIPEVIVIVRGGGSADDLAVFNDEPLVRAVAASRVPVLTGIGHETDESLCDLVADVAAVTPTNAAQLLIPDRNVLIQEMGRHLDWAVERTTMAIEQTERAIDELLAGGVAMIVDHLETTQRSLEQMEQLLGAVNPLSVLARGYALVRGERRVGAILEIEMHEAQIKAEIKEYHER